MEVLIGMLIGACFIFVYRLGLHDGTRLSQGKEIQNVNPVEPIVQAYQHGQAKRQVSKYNQGWENIMAYDGSPQKGDD